MSKVDTNQRNQSFAIENRISFIKGKGGLPFMKVENDASSALISIYGAQVLSFKPKSHADLLFVSEAAHFEQGKAIKGGIPICWPWFGPHAENPAREIHGFARNMIWKLESTASTDTESQVVLSLTDSAGSHLLWPYKFKLELTITIGETLQLSLKTNNTGQDSFKFTQAFHPYFAVGDITQTQVEGLDQVYYLDKVTNAQAPILHSGRIDVKQEVDRIYVDAPAAATVIDAKLKREIAIKTSGSKTTIVWNPWIEISKNSDDLNDDSYQKFICVEAANAAKNIIEVKPNDSYTLGAEYTVSCI